MKNFYRTLISLCFIAGITPSWAYELQIENDTPDAINVQLGHKPQDQKNIEPATALEAKNVEPNSTSLPVTYQTTFDPYNTNVQLGTNTDYWIIDVWDPQDPMKNAWRQAISCPLMNQTVRDGNNIVKQNVVFTIKGSIHDPQSVQVTMALNPTLMCQFVPLR